MTYQKIDIPEIDTCSTYIDKKYGVERAPAHEFAVAAYQSNIKSFEINHTVN